MSGYPLFSTVAARANAKGIMVTSAAVEEIAALLPEPDQPSQHDDLRRLALCAAGQAASATAELLEVAQNGPLGAHGPFNDEPIELLADATKLAIEAARAGGDPADDERDQLYAALCRYLDGSC